MNEEWRPILSHSGYEVSNLGRVRSVDRVIHRIDGHQSRIAGVVLTPNAKCRTGHLWVSLLRNSVRTRRYVHQLVLEAFVSPRPPGCVARHLDDNPSNNSLENLAWGTPSENSFDRVRNGNDFNSNKTHCPKGHPYDDENTMFLRRSNGQKFRVCSICQKANWRAQWHRKDARRKARAAEAARDA